MERLHEGIKIRAHWTWQAWRREDSGLLTPLWNVAYDNLVVTEGRNTLLARTFDAVPADVNWYVGLIGAGAGTVSITSGADAVTGSGTSFTSADNGSDMIIVGAGASGLDLVTTINAFTSGTSVSVANNASATVSGAAYAVEPRPADVMNSKSFNELTAYSEANRQAWTKNGAPASGAMSNSSSKARFTINAANTRIFGGFLSSNNTKGGTTGLLFGGGLFSVGSKLMQSGELLDVQIDLSITAS